MLARKRIAILVGLGIFAVAGAVLAQSDATQQKTLFDRLDDFGKTIFGGILPLRQGRHNESARPFNDAPSHRLYQIIIRRRLAG